MLRIGKKVMIDAHGWEALQAENIRLSSKLQQLHKEFADSKEYDFWHYHHFTLLCEAFEQMQSLVMDTLEQVEQPADELITGHKAYFMAYVKMLKIVVQTNDKIKDAGMKRKQGRFPPSL